MEATTDGSWVYLVRKRTGLRTVRVGADPRVVDTTVRIRIAGPEDATELARLKESWAELSDPATEAELAEFADELRRWTQERGDTVTCAVAELDGILIGMAWLVVFERVPNVRDTRRRTGDIQSVFVQHSYRSRGIGKQLVRALTVMADELGIPRVTVSANARAASMYEALGFEPTPLLLERKARPAPSQQRTGIRADNSHTESLAP